MKWFVVSIICLISNLALSFVIEKEPHRDIDIIKDESWQIWKSAHNKDFHDLYEEKVRYTIWQDNLRRITEFNQGNKGLFLRMNHFGDMTSTEFKKTMNGYLKKTKSTGSTFLAPSNVVVPDTVDWRNNGSVSPVKNQGQCGSCWAFSTTGALEGQHFRKTGKLVDLSEQNLVDCSSSYGNHGCEGGLMDNAFKFIKQNHGIDTEESYPYEGKEGTCRFVKSDIGADDTGFVDIPQGDEDALKIASGTVGPISIAIDASHFSFQFYHSGVYDEEKCDPTQLDHGVLLVGYGTLDGKDFWLVKNSWGPTWGVGGYIRMSRNKNNQCGVASSASYPLV
jgi:cathepsin L